MFTQKKIRSAAIQLLLFLLIFIFFERIFPVYPYDGDDWLYIGSMRVPIPSLHAYNPSKVFPETFEPLTGMISAYVVYPITHKYVESISVIQTLIIASFITCLMFMFYKLLRSKFNLSNVLSLAFEVIFFLSFFALFKLYKMNSGPQYFGFWAKDLNCYWNYIIPGLLNGILLMYLENNSNLSYDILKDKKKGGMMFLYLYLIIFSNIMLNIILASYAFIKIISNLLKIRHRFNVVHFLQITWLYILIDFLWIITVIMDSHGQRANAVSNHTSVGNVLNRYLIFINSKINKAILILSLVFIISCIFILIFSRGKYNQSLNTIFQFLVNCACSLVITFCYLILIFSRAGASYVERPDATWAILFFFLICVVLSLLIIVIKFPFLKYFVPLAILLVGLYCSDQSLAYVRTFSTNGSQELKVDNYIISQVVKADKNGKHSITVKVPRYNRKGNWPHPYKKYAIANTLYNHRIVNSKIKIKVKPDSRVNKHFKVKRSLKNLK